MEVTDADPRHKRPLVGALSSESQELFFFFFLLMFHRTSSRRCVQAQNDAEHFGGNTLCITFGSFSLLRLISSLYYTALDILLLKKAP